MITWISVILGYLLGSVSFSFLAGKLLKGIDIRKHGSGNAGATNTLRVLGKGPAIAVLLLDAAKGVAAVLLGMGLAGGGWAPVLCGLAAVAGHNWPVFFGFRGGKGVATTIGVMATLAFWPALISGILAIVVIALTRYVSLGSLVLVTFLPLSIWLMHGHAEVLLTSLVVVCFVYFRHRSNILKLLRGDENKLGAKR